MKTFLAIALFALAAWTFGPQLFAGELRIHGQKTPEPPAPSVRNCEPGGPTVPAFYALGGLPGESPTFPEPKPRPEPLKPRKTTAPAQDGAISCLGPVCYHGANYIQ